MRWGGDEFVIIVSDGKCDEAYTLAEKIRKIVEHYRFDQVGKVTISSGAVEALKSDTEDSLLKRADDAMYKAKGAGGNRSKAIKM